MPRAGIARSRLHPARVHRRVRAYRKVAPIGHRFAIAIVIAGGCYIIARYYGIEEALRGTEFAAAAIVDKLIFTLGRE